MNESAVRKTEPSLGVKGLVALLQGELRQLAARKLWGERKDHTLQPTALVNEAYLKLVDQRNLDASSKSEFLAVAAQTMRRILVDYARARAAEKRGDGAIRVTLTGLDVGNSDPEFEILALNDAMDQLAIHSPRMASVMQMRYFGGLTVAETAEALKVSERTVADDCVFGRAWLKRAMTPPAATQRTAS